MLTGVGKKAIISDLHEPEGQDMEQETADEFPGTQRHPFGSTVILSIFIGESHFFILYRFDPVVADGNPVGVATKVVQHLLRPGKRLLGVNNPGPLPGQV